MNRDVVAIVGKTGYGKSWWGKLYTKGVERLLVYDPAASFNVDYQDAESLCREFLSDDADPPRTFRVGSYQADDAFVLGASSFVAANNTLVLEEVSTLAPKGARMEPWLSRLVFLGRHRSCSLVVMAQRAASIPIDLRSQINRMVTFSQTEADDLGWLRPFFSVDMIDSLPTMPKFQCLDYWNGNVTSYSIREQVRSVFGITLDNSDIGVYTVG